VRRTVEENNKRRKDKIKETTKKTKLQAISQSVKNINLDKKKILILVACLVVVVVIIIANNYTSLGIIFNKNITSEDAIQIELQTTIEKIIPYGNKILIYSKGKIDIYDNYGKNIETIELQDTADADISTAGKYIQVIDKDKNIVYVYKSEYEIARIKVDGKIYSGNINENGMSVIEYSSNGNKMALGIYDKAGNMEYNIRPSNNIIGKYVLANNSKYLAYTDVDISGISAYTNVNLIDLSHVKEDESNSNVIYTLDNSLAYDIYFDGRNVITRYEEGYLMYNTSSKKVNEIKTSDGQVVNVGDYSNRFAYTKLNSAGNYLLTIGKIGREKVKTVELNDAPKYFEYENGIVYVCYSKNIEAYNNSGVNIKNYTSDMVITKPVIFNNGRSVAMAVSNKLIMFTI